jgi:sialic acid synthase
VDGNYANRNYGKQKIMKETYIIGEIGQNHNGSVDIAKLITELVSKPIQESLFNLDLKPMNAVKLTKRDLDEELSASQMCSPYNNPNSFGKTYGEHRSALELSDEEHFEVYKHAKELGLDFVETLCSPGCTSLLKLFTPNYLKVASRDLTNIPLLEAISETKIPIILSTGMASKIELDHALNVITKSHDEISILHCVSEYPTQPDHLNLNTILYLKKHYPKYRIGFSDHTIGIAAPVVAVGMGAEIIEKHVTIDRGMKGTDQAGSLGPEGVMRMIRDIRIAEKWMGREDFFIEPNVQAARVKLERSVAAKKDLTPGDIISEKDIHLLSPGDGVKWIDRNEIIGTTVIKAVPKNEIIYKEHVQKN